MFKIFLTIYSGLEHAFEADHLLAVNTLVSHRENLKQSMKDGIYWGIGHTATIFFIGILMIGFKFQIGEEVFKNFEAGVGVMLIILGLYRVFKLYFPKEHTHTHNTSRAAFGVGLIHGLAGSGALVVLVISQMKTPLEGLMYILIFGLGSIFGMFLAAYLLLQQRASAIINGISIVPNPIKCLSGGSRCRVIASFNVFACSEVNEITTLWVFTNFWTNRDGLWSCAKASSK